MKRFVLVLLLLASVLRAEDQKPVTPLDQVQFQQKGIAAQMQELEQRMFRLSELTRALEPDDSARLILAVQRAREQLIVDQMKDALGALSGADLSKATDEQRQVLAKLDDLKKLLLNTALDLQAQLAQLKKLEAAIKKLEGIQKDQQAQRDNTAKNPDAKKLENLNKQQQGTQASTNQLAQTVATLGEPGKQANASLNSAAGKMGNASNSLGAGKPSDASAEQDKALNDLKEARKSLEEQKQKLLAEIERQVRKQVIANLTEMLDRQKGIREAMVPQASRAEAGDREAILNVQKLAMAEQRVITLTDQTLILINETKFSDALPPVLESIGRRCVYLQTDLTAGRAGQPVQAASKEIEDDLAALIETFKELARSSGNPSQCKGCKGDKNKLLAELKVLRLLQVRVNEETLDADGRRASAEAELTPELRTKIGTTKDHQETAQKTAAKIHERVCPDCLNH